MGFFSRKKSNAIPIQPAVNEVDKALQYIQKVNSIYSAQMGIGTSSDPIEAMNVVENPIYGSEARRLYRNLDLMQRIVDAPVNDSLKNGYEITTDHDEELGLNELITERLKELDFDKKLKEFGINSRLYSKGGFLYPVIKEYNEKPPSQPLSLYNLEKIEAFNVVYEEHLTYFSQITNPFAADYGKLKQTYLLGSHVHDSRYHLYVPSFDPFLNRGVSLIDRVKRAVFGINIAQWTVTELLRRYRVLIVNFDPKQLAAMTGEQKTDAKAVLKIIARAATSKSVVPVPAGQEFKYLQSTLTDIDKAINTLYDFLSAVSEIPQRKIRGSAAGELAAADTDERQYHEMLESSLHKATFDPTIRYAANLVMNEREGKIYETLFEAGITPESVNLEIKFNPIASVNPMTEAQINLLKSQTASADITAGVPKDMALKDRYPELDEVIPESDFDEERSPDSMGAFDVLNKMKDAMGLSN